MAQPEDQLRCTGEAELGQHFQLWERVAGALARDTGGPPAIWILEDLHAADLGTLDLLTILISGMPLGTVLVTTCRRDELPVADRARDWLAGVSRLAGVVQMNLAPLRNEDVEELVVSLVDGEPAAGFVADVLRRGQGSPFFTEQLVANAMSADPLSAANVQVPDGVAALLLTRR